MRNKQVWIQVLFVKVFLRCRNYAVLLPNFPFIPGESAAITNPTPLFLRGTGVKRTAASELQTLDKKPRTSLAAPHFPLRQSQPAGETPVRTPQSSLLFPKLATQTDTPAATSELSAFKADTPSFRLPSMPMPGSGVMPGQVLSMMQYSSNMKAACQKQFAAGHEPQ